MAPIRRSRTYPTFLSLLRPLWDRYRNEKLLYSFVLHFFQTRRTQREVNVCNCASTHQFKDSQLQSFKELNHRIGNHRAMKRRVKWRKKGKQAPLVGFNKFYSMPKENHILLLYSFSSRYRVFWQHWQLGTHFPGQRSSMISSVMIFATQNVKDSMIPGRTQIWTIFGIWSKSLIISSLFVSNVSTRWLYAKEANVLLLKPTGHWWRELWIVLPEGY